MDKNHIAVRLYLCFAMAITMVSAQVQGNEGGTMRITCSVAGTLPRWIKDSSIIFTNEGNSMINPDYSTRFSYAADQKTLVVSPVQLSDAGRYKCLIGGILGTDVVVSVLTSTTTPRSSEEKGLTKTTMIIVIVCSCGVTAIVVFIVLLVIRRWKHSKEKKSPNEMVDSKGQNVNSRNEFSDNHGTLTIKLNDAQPASDSVHVYTGPAK